MATAIQTDWLQKIRDGEMIDSAEMAYFVEKLNKVDPAKGESKQIFSARDVALVLFGTAETKGVYALCDSNAIGHIDVGTGTKRKCMFTRYAIYEFLRGRCADQSQFKRI